MNKILLYLLIFSFNGHLYAQYRIDVLDSGRFILGEGVILTKTSFRGLSVVDDNVIWGSGSRGTIARSTNGGKSFHFDQIKGYEKSDFRDIEAFDDKNAIVMSSGTPAYILKTHDGGLTWKEVFKDTRPEVFLDAMDFWDKKRGVIVGDPINDHFLLLSTKDGGDSWKIHNSENTPASLDSEAVFAASGTILRCGSNGSIAFGSGGKYSRLFYSSNYGNTWSTSEANIIQGRSSQGIFSIILSKDKIIYAGGDYTKDSLTTNNYGILSLKDKSIALSNDLFTYYLSSIETLPDAYIACGTRGVMIQNMSSQNWQSLSKESFNVIRKAKKGTTVFIAGGKGKIAKLIPTK